MSAPATLNVLSIAVDDLRPQLGCYGDATTVTPHIDGLADRGVVFRRAYCQQAVCNPSRASLMTGLRPDTTKVWDLKTHFRKALPDVVTLPQYFKEQGYHTQCIGKIYHDPAAAQDPVSWSVPETFAVTDDCGGKYVLPDNVVKYEQTKLHKAAAAECADVPDSAYIDGRVAEAAVAVLNTIKDKPFFLGVGFRRPHLPFSAPRKYWELYRREELSLPENTFKPKNCPDIALHNWQELRGYTDIPEIGPVDEDKARELIHGYYAATSYTDAQIAKVVGHLDKLGLRGNTVIVLWGDNGWHLGEHGLWGKTTNFELDTRIPLIISAPGFRQEGKADELVELVDLYPTLCDICGLGIPDGLEGTSLVPLLREAGLGASPWKDAAFSQYPGWPGAPGRVSRPEFEHVMGYSMRTDRYRYTEWVHLVSGDAVASELYDYDQDPGETVNLAGQPELRDLAASLAVKLKRGWKGALPGAKEGKI
jgi:iduronate 2-sulfatase